MHVGHRRPEQRQPFLAVVAGDAGELGEGLARLLGLAHEHAVVPDADIGGDEVGVQRERLLVVLDGVVEAAHLHEQLGVRVVGVGIGRDELDVLLEGLLRVGVLAEEAVRVAELVVGLREGGVDRGRLRVFLRRRRVVLAGEMVRAHQVVRALVVGEGGHQLRQAVLLALRVTFRARVQLADDETLGLGGLVGQRDRAAHGREELLGRARRVGQADLDQREARVLGRRLLEELPRVGGAQLLGEVASLEVRLTRVRGRRGDRDPVRRRGGDGRADAERAQHGQPACTEVVHHDLLLDGGSLTPAVGPAGVKLRQALLVAIRDLNALDLARNENLRRARHVK